MSEVFLPGDPPIPLFLRRSPRARRISLRVSQLDGRVTLTLPQRLAEREALDFARSKEGWIRKHLSERGQNIPIGYGAKLPVEGQLMQVVPATGRRVEIAQATIAVPGREAQVGKRLQAHLKELARVRLVAACDTYAARLGRDYSQIALRDTRSRWGSCTTAGRLMFSWRLILSPPRVLRYVAAHEVAHLDQMNHSPAFWAGVSRIFGDYAEPRAWLRQHGSELHRYDFF